VCVCCVCVCAHACMWPPATCRRGLRCVWGSSKVYQERVSVSGCWAPLRCIAEAAPRMQGKCDESCKSSTREGVCNTRACVVRETGLRCGHWSVQQVQSAADDLGCPGTHCSMCVCATCDLREKRGVRSTVSPSAASNAKSARLLCIHRMHCPKRYHQSEVVWRHRVASNPHNPNETVKGSKVCVSWWWVCSV
jgi:hypothetical protein